ncbi:hypothetical protein [Solicola gregarius]|uniref:Uncharacterized protein n=1 Tax=Solicola gregarius TaxID=2908642 RepID=A0AA46TFW2_9ACTN|nr:hypothetical protein [Solicola gregarius]UYM04356.1 hypothetical protein L0C25_17700 [Solicola gregarius]
MSARASDDLPVAPRWRTTRRVAGYAAATTMSCYLVVKAVWVFAGLADGSPSGSGMSTSEWITLNVASIVMSATGAALGIAIAQPWGNLLPAGPVVFFAWIGSGLLVPMIPYMLAAAALSATSLDDSAHESAASSSASIPGWESILLNVGFAGMALGLAVGLPIYLRERWPSAFVATAPPASARNAARQRSVVLLALLLPAVVGIATAFWATAGSGPGVSAAYRDGPDARLLDANTAGWSLLGAFTVWRLIARPQAHAAAKRVIAFVVSGHLFGWSAWRLAALAFGPDSFEPTRAVGVAVVEYAASIAAGVAMLAVVLRSCVRSRELHPAREPDAAR